MTGEELAQSGSQVPVWLLDVDGVVNASKPRWGAPPHHATAYAHGRMWKLRWAPALVDQLRAWHRRGLVELRWATTWCPEADELERLWAFPPLARSLTEAQSASRAVATRAKLDAALAVVEVERRPLIWTDDDAIPSAGPDLERLRGAVHPALLLAPREKEGLSRDDVARIQRFIEALPAPPA